MKLDHARTRTGLVRPKPDLSKSGLARSNLSLVRPKPVLGLTSRESRYYLSARSGILTLLSQKSLLDVFCLNLR